MQEILPRPANVTQQEWDEILLVEAPSVLGLASSAANVLDTPSVSDDELADTSISSSLEVMEADGTQDPLPSPSETCTSLPYSPSDSEVPGED